MRLAALTGEVKVRMPVPRLKIRLPAKELVPAEPTLADAADTVRALPVPEIEPMLTWLPVLVNVVEAVLKAALPV